MLEEDAPSSAMGLPAPRRRAPLVLLEMATLLSGTGSAVAMVALPWLVLGATGDASAAGVVGATTAVPLLLSSLFSGTLVDLVGRRRMSVLSDLCSALAVAAIPLSNIAGGVSVPLIALLAALGALFDPAGVTARETLLPGAAQAGGLLLARVNGLHETIWGLAFLIGPGLGGLLIALVGAQATLWVTVVGFAASAALVSCIRQLALARYRGAPKLAVGERLIVGVEQGRDEPAGDLRGEHRRPLSLGGGPVGIGCAERFDELVGPCLVGRRRSSLIWLGCCRPARAVRREPRISGGPRS